MTAGVDNLQYPSYRHASENTVATRVYSPYLIHGTNGDCSRPRVF